MSISACKSHFNIEIPIHALYIAKEAAGWYKASFHCDTTYWKVVNSTFLSFSFILQVIECHESLGLESGAISDGQVTASSQWDDDHAAIQGRLHFEAGRGKAGGWSARRNDVNQWLQVDLGSRTTKVTGIATQGRRAYSQWVTKYMLQFSKDGVHFQYYREPGKKAKKVKRFKQPNIFISSK